ncbi:MAG TPA: OsmC family protein [Candidatus Methylomirabilis sp.]|nr:OsmC family protein [Candidatus Methylomirabilis sp.]
MSMTVVLYARRKGWPLTRVTVDLRHEKVHAKECAECGTKVGKVDRIETRMELEGDLTDEQYTRLLEISERCPIKKSLASEVVIVAK